jgi:serine/threonine-protein kinase
LKKVSLDGRPSVTLFTLSGTRRGASWGDNDMIVFAQGGSSSLWRVGASGGEAEEITVDGAEQLSDRRWVDVLPGGEAALVTVWLGGLDDAQIAIESLDTGEQEILVAGTSPRYVPTGHIVYWREGSIWAVPFDVERKALAGSAAPVVEDVAANTGGLAHFAVAANGSLAYLPGSATGQRTLVWVDREGVEQQIEIPSGTYSTPRVSPDGTRIVTANLSEELDLWTYQIGRGTSQRLTYDPGEDSSPVWTSDGTKVAFRSTGRDGGPGIFWKAADGTGNAERLSVGDHVPSSVSPDDTQLLFSDVTDGHIGLLSLDGEPNPEVLLESQFRAQHVVVSPGGQWMAFAGDDTGMNEIYVRPFPDVESARWQVSTGGGTEPVWSPDGRELFYRMGAAVMSVPVSDGLPSTWGTPEVVFRGTYRLETVGLYSHYYDVSPDGDRFLLIQEAFSQGDGTVPDMIFVEHWFEELTQIAPRIDP